MDALFVSQPLHFGDYGGMPMKILWVILDLISITVLVTGLYLFFTRRKSAEEQPDFSVANKSLEETAA